MERGGLRRLLWETIPCRAGADGSLFVGDNLPPGAAEGMPAPEGGPARGWLCVATGGSSGTPKFARHDEATVGAAAEGFRRHFGVAKVDALGLLPETHVSGLMARLRCALTGGHYRRGDWKAVERGILPEAPEGGFVSLVPTQLQRLLPNAAARDWLRRFRAVLLGGGPCRASLLDAAEDARLPLSPGYGMTETAAMVAALPPEAFLRGRRGCGPALPHARVETDAGGRLRVGGASLFRGYWGAADVDGGSLWPTEDAGAFVDGSLVVRGRLDAVIISGGKKIAPEEIEAAALESGAAEDAAALGVPDAEWGERLVLCFPAGRGDAAALKAFFETRLEGWKRPKKIIALSSWPRDAKGKLNRRELRAALPPEDLAGTFS